MGPGGGPPGAPGEKAKDFKSATKRLFKELGRWKWLILIGLIFAALSSIIFILAPDELAKLTDEIKEGITGQMNMDKVTHFTIVVAVLYVISSICGYFQSISMTYVANKFAKSLRTRISKKINKLPLSFFDKHQTGDILSIVTNDVDTIAQSMNNCLATLVGSIAMFV